MRTFKSGKLLMTDPARKVRFFEQFKIAADIGGKPPSMADLFYLKNAGGISGGAYYSGEILANPGRGEKFWGHHGREGFACEKSGLFVPPELIQKAEDRSEAIEEGLFGCPTGCILITARVNLENLQKAKKYKGMRVVESDDFGAIFDVEQRWNKPARIKSWGRSGYYYESGIPATKGYHLTYSKDIAYACLKEGVWPLIIRPNTKNSKGETITIIGVSHPDTQRNVLCINIVRDYSSASK